MQPHATTFNTWSQSVVVSQVDERDREKEVIENISTPQVGTGTISKGKNCSLLAFATQKRAWEALLAGISLAATAI